MTATMQQKSGWQGTSRRPSRKPSVQNAKQAMQTLPCMWIYGTKLRANYFPTSLNTYGHPRTQHNQSCAMSWKPGQLWNMNMAYVRKMPYIKGLRTATSNACPLCSLEDSGSHLLGGCRHRDMVKSHIARHKEAGRLILKAITKGTSGNNIVINVFIADLGTQENMQAMGVLDTRLPHWLAQETTISKMRQDGEERNRTADSFGITAPEDRLKTRADIMTLVDLTTNDLCSIENRAPKKRKADGEQATIKDMIGRRRLQYWGLDTQRIPDTKTSPKPRFSNTNPSVRSLKRKGTG